jgi:chromosome segregation and condensation protein ScpB
MDENIEIREEAAGLEALLFASSRPLSTKTLAKTLRMSEGRTLELLHDLRSDLE